MGRFTIESFYTELPLKQIILSSLAAYPLELWYIHIHIYIYIYICISVINPTESKTKQCKQRSVLNKRSKRKLNVYFIIDQVEIYGSFIQTNCPLAECRDVAPNKITAVGPFAVPSMWSDSLKYYS